MALDGELWAGRGRFAEAVSTVRQQQPDDATWRRMHFMVFDLPEHPGEFAERDAQLAQIALSIGQSWVQHVAQTKVADPVALQVALDRVVEAGGEGLVLHRADSHYAAGRSDDLLKFKPYIDADVRVVGYEPGKGKYAGMLGALLVESDAGLRFRLGSGLTDELRRAPPPVGSWVSYRYNGVNDKTGIPRFARFLRVRPDLSP
jgi:DNA ligase-1